MSLAYKGRLETANDLVTVITFGTTMFSLGKLHAAADTENYKANHTSCKAGKESKQTIRKIFKPKPFSDSLSLDGLTICL